MKTLQIIRSAYRATVEEQDDTVVWLTRAMNAAGGQFDVLLSGDAVNYTVAGQDATGLEFGDWRQTQPPRIASEIAGLVADNANVFFVSDDAEHLGLDDVEQIEGIQRIERAHIADLLDRYVQIWKW